MRFPLFQFHVNRLADAIASRLRRDIDTEAPPPAPIILPCGLQIFDLGISFDGEHIVDVVGYPYRALMALVGAPGRRASVARLRERMGIEDLNIDYPDDAVKNAIKDLRKAIGQAAKLAGLPKPDLIRRLGRGADCGYALEADGKPAV